MKRTKDLQPVSTIRGTGAAKGGLVPVYDVIVSGGLEKEFDATFQEALQQTYGMDGHHYGDEYHDNQVMTRCSRCLAWIGTIVVLNPE